MELVDRGMRNAVPASRHHIGREVQRETEIKDKSRTERAEKGAGKNGVSKVRDHRSKSDGGDGCGGARGGGPVSSLTQSVSETERERARTLAFLLLFFSIGCHCQTEMDGRTHARTPDTEDIKRTRRGSEWVQ